MNKENKIQITIETPAIGDVVMEVPYSDVDKSSDNFVVEIPNRIFWGTDYTNLDLTYVVEKDIESFEKLNKINDSEHQVYIDTLCIYGVRISGNYIRIQYWFHQDNDVNSHRMADGQLVHCCERGSFINKDVKVYPQGYSSDVCVYW